jgi:hypothetical protein
MGWINITTLLKMRNLKGSDFANIALKTGQVLSNCCQNCSEICSKNVRHLEGVYTGKTDALKTKQGTVLGAFLI